MSHPERRPMTPVLVLAEAPAAASRLGSDLEGQGVQVLGRTDCRHLVRDAVRLAPEVVVAWAEPADAPFFDALALLADAAPCAVLAFSNDDSPAALARALDGAVAAWVVDGYAPQRLPALLALAALRHRRDRARLQQLAGLQARLDERKWIDRAKGLLMRDNALSEDQAFSLLRTASMHANLRVGEVSRGVIEAAQSADAINRAGQLRMLSQRLVKCRALMLSGVEVEDMRLLAKQSCERVDSALAHLRALPLGEAIGALREAVLQAWTALKPALDLEPAAVLAEIQPRAERLLLAAEALTSALEAASGRRSLHVVNLSGRQRMLSQRVAMLALLHAVGVLAAGEAEASLRESAAEFEQALAELERAPLSVEGIRSGLAQARAQWLRLRESLRACGSRAGMQALARESEALLASFEDLTERYEHSMQVLLA